MIESGDSDTPGAVIELLPWDSDFFGFAVGRVDPRDLPIVDVQDEARRRGIRCVYCTCDSSDAAALIAAGDARFLLADVRVNMRRPVQDFMAPMVPTEEVPAVTPVRHADLQALEAIAAELAAYSRFAFDPHFGARTSRRLYKAWLAASCRGRADVVLVARAEGGPLGFVTCRIVAARGHIELVAVRSDQGGRGVGSALVSRALQWFGDSGVREVDVVTQGRNPRAINFYTRCGFRLDNVQLVYHGWF